MPYSPAADPGQIRPKKRWYWVGVLVVLLGIVGGIAGFVLGVVFIGNSFSIETEFSSGETATFQADQANTDSDSWKLYADRDVPFRDVERDCQVTGPNEQEVGLSEPGYSSETTVNGQTSAVVSHLDVTEPGEYTIECAADTDAGFGVGYGPDSGSGAQGFLGSIAVLFLVPLLGFLVGVTTIVVTAVRRGRHKKRLRAAPSPSG